MSSTFKMAVLALLFVASGASGMEKDDDAMKFKRALTSTSKSFLNFKNCDRNSAQEALSIIYSNIVHLLQDNEDYQQDIIRALSSEFKSSGAYENGCSIMDSYRDGEMPGYAELVESFGHLVMLFANDYYELQVGGSYINQGMIARGVNQLDRDAKLACLLRCLRPDLYNTDLNSMNNTVELSQYSAFIKYDEFRKIYNINNGAIPKSVS